jgi:hypothetical protein
MVRKFSTQKKKKPQLLNSFLGSFLPFWFAPWSFLVRFLGSFGSRLKIKLKVGYCYWSVSCGAQTPLRHPRTGKPDSPGASVTSCLRLVNVVLPALLTGTIDRLRFWKSQTYLYLLLLLLLLRVGTYMVGPVVILPNYLLPRNSRLKNPFFFTLWVKS